MMRRFCMSGVSRHNGTWPTSFQVTCSRSPNMPSGDVSKSIALVVERDRADLCRAVRSRCRSTRHRPRDFPVVQASSIEVQDTMRKRTSGCRALKGVVSDATMPSTVGIAAIRISPDSPSLSDVDFLPHRRAVADDAARPVERPLALGREALETRAALHQHDAEDFLELLEAGRHRRLGDAAGFGGTSEVTFLCQRQQQFKLVDQKVASRYASATNYHGPCRRQVRSRLQKSSFKAADLSIGSFGFHIICIFMILIDRLSVSQHETALLISGSIPILMCCVNKRSDREARMTASLRTMGCRSRRRDHRAAHADLEGATLPILHALQEAFGYVPEPAIPMIAEALNLSRAEVHGVVTFYHDFRREPAGRHVLKLCRAEACQAAGGDALAARAEAQARHRDRKHHGRRAGHAGAGLLPRPLRHGALGDARWPRGRPARRSAHRRAGRGGAAMTLRIFIPRDAGAVAVGADEVAPVLRAGGWQRAASPSRSSAPARAGCIGWSRWSRSRRRRAASPTAR